MNLPSPPQVQPVQRLSFTKPQHAAKAHTCVNLKPRYDGEPPILKETGEFARYMQMRIELLHGANYDAPGPYTGAVANQGCHLFSSQQMGANPTAMATCLAGGGIF